MRAKCTIPGNNSEKVEWIKEMYMSIYCDWIFHRLEIQEQEIFQGQAC